MNLPPEIERHREEIRCLIESSGAELVDIEFRKSSGRRVLGFLVDRQGGITLEQCVAINRQLSEYFDRLSEVADEAADTIKNAYVLEVGSPGLDRPLVSEKDFCRALNETVRVIYKDDSGKTWTAQGVLVSVASGRIGLRDKKDRTIDLDRATVVKALRVIELGS